MIKFQMNGKPFNPKNLKEKILQAAMQKLGEQLREKIGAIRHPETGEFPTIVVSGTSFENIKVRVEGSPELLALVNERIAHAEDKDEQTPMNAVDRPRVFLSYSWDDSELASKIAHALMANGIETWWDKWCISAGDSFRQRIDEGLDDCTHFVVLLTPDSITKPWVNQEMDAGLMRKLQAKSKFIPLRHQVKPSELPPLLSGMHSPAIENPDSDIQQLINDIYGVSKKPPLGSPPSAVINTESFKTGYSAAANTIAKIFVEKTQYARFLDPNFSFNDLVSLSGLTDDDVSDAIYELQGFVTRRRESMVYAEEELFVKFDEFWMPWNPATDALKLASDMISDDAFPVSPEEIANKYGWDERRLNPALAYLTNRELVRSLKAMGGGNFLVLRIIKSDATRRFVKSRS